jgi:hypothetical protein
MELEMHKYFSNLFHELKSFFAHEAGSVVIISAIVLPVLLGVSGMSLDYIRAYSLRTTLQGAIDSAVLAGVTSSQDEEQQIIAAKAYFDSIGDELGQNVSANFYHQGDNLIGDANTTVDTTILGIMGIQNVDVAVSAAATTKQLLAAACFMAMHPQRKHTLELKDSVSVIAPDCHIYGNSSHPYDVVDPHKPENYLTGKSVQAIGYGHHYLENVTPPLEYAPELLPDPLAALTIPSAGSCDYDNLEVNGGSMTLSPGTYCNGLEISNGANVTLQSGTYIIADETFKLSNSNLSGDGVTIVLADDGVKLDWEDSEVRLKAPSSGALVSMALIGVRENLKHILRDSVIDIHGVIYLPNGEFEWQNTGTPTINAKWTVWIVDGITWKGDGTIYINFDIKDEEVPYPGDLRYVIPRPSTPRLVL